MADEGEELSALRKRLIELQRRRTHEFPRQLRPDDSDGHELESEIRDTQARIRAIDPKTRADPELANPDAAGEDLSIFVDAAETTSDPRSQAARERARAAEAEREARERERVEADLAKERADEVRPWTEEAEGIDLARQRGPDTSRKIDLAAQRGCLASRGPLVAIVAFFAAVVLALVGVVLFGGGSGEDAARVAGGNGAGGAGNSQGGGDASAFAGQYVLASGLDNPDGLDLHNFGGRGVATDIAATAAIDIAANGQVTGGSLNVSGNAEGCAYTFDAGSASGSVTASGSGSVVFAGTQTQGGPSCSSFSDPTGRSYNFGVTENGLFLCRTPMPTLTTCEGGSAPRAHFRQT